MRYLFIALIFSLSIGNVNGDVKDNRKTNSSTWSCTDIHNEMLFMTVSTISNKTILFTDFYFSVQFYPELGYAALYDDIKLAKYAINRVKKEYWHTVTGNLEDNFDTPNLILSSLAISTSYNSKNVLHMLLSDPRLKLKQDYLYYLLMVAAECGARDSLSVLIKAGADINFNFNKSKNGDVFMHSLITENPDFAMDLINYGFTFCGERGETRIFRDFFKKSYTYKEYALSKGYREIYNLIPDCL